MRIMMIVKATPESEANFMPSQEDLAAMGTYNEELVNAGVMLAGEGLHPTSRGKRIRFDGPEKRTVVDGPFTDAKELIAGFWILQVTSWDEAVAWARKIPFQEGEVELRQVFETEEFAAADPTGEIRAQEHELRRRVEARSEA